MHFLASYPRSGNTLLRMILWHRFGIRSSSVYESEGWAEMTDIVGAAKTALYVKTHKLYEGEYTKHPGPHIYVERNREAVIDSCFEFWKQTATKEQIANGELPFGSIEDHKASWRACNPLWLHYESLLSDVTLQRLEAFTGRSVRPGAIPTFKDLQSMKPSFFKRGYTR